MSIIDTTATPEEALVYKYIFMDELTITQAKYTHTSVTPIYQVKISYRKFAIDSLGNTHYKTKSDSIILDDYLSEAQAKASVGDYDLLNAIGTIQVAVSNIITDKTELKTEVI